MVRYRRNLLPGGTFFFTVAVEDRRSSVLIEHVVSLRNAFRTARDKKPFGIDAIVILPDHLHAIITLPPGDFDFPDRWRQIKSHFTPSVVAAGLPIARNQRGEYALWQKRYWEHTIRGDSDFERCANYIHFNPVKHGQVGSPIDWPYSSLRRYVRAGLLPPDWGGAGPMIDGDFGERIG